MTAKQISIFQKVKEFIYVGGFCFSMGCAYTSITAKQDEIILKVNYELQEIKAMHKKDFDFLTYKYDALKNQVNYNTQQLNEKQ